MRATALTCLLCAAICAGPLHAQTLQEIEKKNLAARGGEQAIRAVKTARFAGTMTMGGEVETPFTMEWKRPGKFRLEFTLGGQTGVQAFDGETAWVHLPFLGMPEPRVVPPEQTSGILEQLDLIDGPFIDTAKRGLKLELVGKQEEGPTGPAFKVKVEREGGATTYHYFDAQSFLEVRRDSGDRSVTFGEYGDADGLRFPHLFETAAGAEAAGQSVRLTEVKLNVDISDARFEMPRSSEAPAGN